MGKTNRPDGRSEDNRTQRQLSTYWEQRRRQQRGKLSRIEADRQALGVSQLKLCAEANVAERTYRRMLKDETIGQRSTLARLGVAIARIRRFQQ